MKTKLAIAPCSWGIENPADPANPHWKTVLDEACEAGYGGMELGPSGYLPQDPVLLKDQFQARKLFPVAATIYDDLPNPANLENLVKKTHAACKLLSSIKDSNQTAYLVIIDKVQPERNHTAGQSDKAVRLDADDWCLLMEHIELLSRISAGDYGIRPVIHPHAGGFIEFEDETERIMQALPHELAGLCLDTGHLYYAGEDPVESLRKYAKRLDYIHFKDIDRRVYSHAIQRGQGFFDACKDGVMCSIGNGCLDYGSIAQILRQLDYQGWITIEQERDPRNSAGVLADIQSSLQFLVEQGF